VARSAGWGGSKTIFQIMMIIILSAEEGVLTFFIFKFKKFLLSTPSSAGGRWREAPDGGNQNMPDKNILKDRSRLLRKDMTVAEKKLWAQLRKKRFSNLRFRRQVVLGKYIVDFISLEPKIIVEVDGSQHADQINYDLKRTAYLESIGYKVLRYWNNEVLGSIDTVLEDIWQHCF